VSQDRRITRSVALLAIGGVIGPLAFVTTWVVAGRVAPGYSPVGDAISDLAATHASTRVAMTLGFVAFGIGVIAFGLALRGAGAGAAWISAVATAGFTLAVAATPLGEPTRDVAHGTFAALGYITLVGVPLLSARTFAAAARVGWARYSGATAALAATCLLASAAGPAHGLFQRVGLTVGDAWLVIVASHLVLRHDIFGPAS
jgi:hypothetical protein